MSPRRPQSEAVFCGCCGRAVRGSYLDSEREPGDWCSQCITHLGKKGAPWERTYFALHGADCPWQVAT